MLCKKCGKELEKDGNIISLSCPFCQETIENTSDPTVSKKKGKITAIPSPVKHPSTPEETFQTLLRTVENGDLDSAFSVASAYFYGEGVSRNLEKAFEYFQKSADHGDIDGIFQVGMSYFQGLGVITDAEKAYEYFQKAAELNHPKGYILLGIFHTSATSHHFNPEKGVEFLEKGAVHEPDSAAVPLGICYSQGIGVEKDIKKALHWFELGLQNGNEVAMYHWANLHIKGEQVPQDYSKAIPLLIKSSEGNCPEACYLLAQCYFCGAGVLENWAAGIRYTRKGDDILKRLTPFIDQLDFYVHPLFLPGFGILELENLVEMGTSIYLRYALGLLYEKAGQMDKALQIFHDCEEENLPQALFKLGEYYQAQQGESLEKGVEYYEKSAKSHYAPGLCALGHCYEEGIGRQKNPEFAYFYYQKAAAQDYGPGLFNLGLCYDKGIFVDKNPKKAQQYFKKSVEQGYEPAKEFCDK